MHYVPYSLPVEVPRQFGVLLSVGSLQVGERLLKELLYYLRLHCMVFVYEVSCD